MTVCGDGVSDWAHREHAPPDAPEERFPQGHKLPTGETLICYTDDGSPIWSEPVGGFEEALVTGPHTTAAVRSRWWDATSGSYCDACLYVYGKLDAALAELALVRAYLETAREAARRAKSIATAPDYDEEAIRDALWAVVDAVLRADEEGKEPRD